MLIKILMWIVLVAALLIGALFSGAETGIYQLSRLRLRLGLRKHQRSYVLLSKIMADSPGLLISLLIGTNLTYFIITSFVTLMFLGAFADEHTVELFATLVTAPVLFVFSELIPKNVFYYRADSLMPYVAPILYAFKKVFTWCGAVPLLKFISRLFARITGSPTPAKTVAASARSSHIKSIIRDTHEEAFLSPVQTDMINRIANISHLSIRSVMIPFSRVKIVSVDSDRPALLEKLKESPHTRIPVYEGSRTNIIGFINIYSALASGREFADLREFVKPITPLPADTIVSDALNKMQHADQRIVLVTRHLPPAAAKPLGILTTKDLIEELLGELTEW